MLLRGCGGGTVRIRYVRSLLVICAMRMIFRLMFNLISSRRYEGNDAFFVSTTYFHNSSSFPRDTMAMLVIARQGLNWHLPLLCVSSGVSGTIATPIHVRYANGHDLAVCKWTTFLLTCRTVAHPTHFVLGAAFWEPFKISYNVPSRIRHDVVVCFSPLFLNERWQLLFAAIEVYRYYGAALQVIYVQSILSRLMTILRGYKSEGIVEILPWFKVQLYRTIRLPYDPNHEMEWRNQLAAHTDCLYRHKESTEFIIFGDIDDILMPRVRSSYLEELRYWANENPSAAFFQYERVQSYLIAASNPIHYNIGTMLATKRIDREIFLTGKYAAIPSRIFTAWLHWPVLLSGFYNHYDIPEEQNFIFHWRHFNFTETGIRKSNGTIETIGVNFAFNLSAISAIQSNFRAFLHRRSFTSLFHSLPMEEVYFKRVEQCYDNIYYKEYWDQLDPNRPISNCPGPFKCAMPKMPGVRCIQARNVYRHNILHETFVISVLAYSEFVEHLDGCMI